MIPLQFCKSSHLLFGLYDPPVGRSAKCGVVICNPAGVEYYRGYSSVRHLAKSLQRVGVHVVRFDYFGTGDSNGSPEDASVECWTRDAEAAVEELKVVGGLQKVSIVGARLGAVIASRVAEHRSDIDRIVLWDPVSDTLEHLQEYANQCRTGRLTIPQGWPEKGSEQVVDLDGFRVTSRMATELLDAEIDIRKWRGVREALLVSDCQPASAHRGLYSRAEGRDPTIDVLDLNGPNVWSAEGDFGSAGIPVDAIKSIVDWLK